MNLVGKVTIGLVLVALVSSGILSACRAAPVSTQKVGFGDWGVGPTCLAPFYVALEEGFFEQKGLDVEYVRYPGMKESTKPYLWVRYTFRLYLLTWSIS